ncbi:MAG: delta-class carbonic anhydrase [Rhodomicrobium sp.]
MFTSCPAPATPYLEGLANCTRCPHPTLRVEAKVFHIESEGDDFAKFDRAADKAQLKSLPDASGAVEYQGSTTGSSYNNDTKCSPASATWNVRPDCSPLKLASLKSWCAHNDYHEHLVHGVRPLVTNAELLSDLKK